MFLSLSDLNILHVYFLYSFSICFNSSLSPTTITNSIICLSSSTAISSKILVHLSFLIPLFLFKSIIRLIILIMSYPLKYTTPSILFNTYIPIQIYIFSNYIHRLLSLETHYCLYIFSNLIFLRRLSFV